MPLLDDTIAAIATPLGEGGIAIVRVSGPEAFGCVAECLTGRVDPRKAASHTIHVAGLRNRDGEIIDQVLFSIFRAPNSYTGEDVLEISCHGGLLVSRRVLEAILSTGVRHAAPGEFTKRAFVNGKLDLAQAEAVAELIHASSDAAQRTSVSHLRGELSDKLEAIRRSLMEAMGLLELELDFAEDGYEFVEKEKIEHLLEDSLSHVKALIGSYTAGKVIREGVHTVLIGAPNAGKSSLMNRLLRESRAIVTEIPGTTRDAISENIMIEGVLFRLTDTAGIRPSDDPVEREGVKKSREKLSVADVIILVLDVTRPIEAQIAEIGEEAIRIIGTRRESVQVVMNKTDLEHTAAPVPKEIAHIKPISPVSAKTGDGIPALEKSLLAHIPGLGPAGVPEGDIVTTARHHAVFLRVAESLRLALSSLKEGKTGEFIALDLRGAMDGLGEIVGKTTSEEVLNEIFSRFCIGK